ncbi:MAG: menaquinone biosynthesis protein [Bacteroidales bacterium]|nr:menaquinone biosynthesis protein [Bacteroidales bacterium]
MNKIAAVSYINTYPFIYGIEQSGIFNPHEFSLNKIYPSLCSRAFHNKEAEVVLMPSGAISDFDESITIPGYCIGATQNVRSVMLFSQVPIENIKTILLDYQSTTSIKLLKILFHYFWKKEVTFIATQSDFEQEINGNTAGLIIGDRALYLENKFLFKTDLAQAWVAFTNLPFVFAYWVKTSPIDHQWLKKFIDSLKWGVEHKKESLVQYTNFNQALYEYLNFNISFHFDEKKIEGLKAFYQLAKKI